MFLFLLTPPLDCLCLLLAALRRSQASKQAGPKTSSIVRRMDTHPVAIRRKDVDWHRGVPDRRPPRFVGPTPTQIGSRPRSDKERLSVSYTPLQSPTAQIWSGSIVLMRKPGKVHFSLTDDRWSTKRHTPRRRKRCVCVVAVHVPLLFTPPSVALSCFPPAQKGIHFGAALCAPPSLL